MSTADATMPDLDPHDPLEASLIDLFAVQPGALALDHIDERMDRAIRAWRPRPSRAVRLRPGRRAGLIGLLAAAFVVAGATGNLRNLYLFLAGPFDVPWHRGVELNLSQEVDGYRVTLDRAYADATRLALAIRVVDEREREGTTQLMAFSTIVTDEAGEYGGMGAMSTPDGAFAAANVAWKTPSALPLPAGPRRFHVVLPFIMVRDDSTPPPEPNAWNPWHRHAGPWTFDFELEVEGGELITPRVSNEIDGTRVEVARIIVTRELVRAELKIDGLPGEAWSPVGEIRHGDRVLRFVAGTTGADGTFALMTDGGVDDASGAWSARIELAGGEGDPLGPWVLDFTAP